MPDASAAINTKPRPLMCPENQKPTVSAPSPARTPSESKPETPDIQSPPAPCPPVRRQSRNHAPLPDWIADRPEFTGGFSETDLDYDLEEAARERELLIEESADYNDNFARSSDEGWFYSDED
jgi:hypothetical protein